MKSNKSDDYDVFYKASIPIKFKGVVFGVDSTVWVALGPYQECFRS